MLLQFVLEGFNLVKTQILRMSLISYLLFTLYSLGLHLVGQFLSEIFFLICTSSFRAEHKWTWVCINRHDWSLIFRIASANLHVVSFLVRNDRGFWLFPVSSGDVWDQKNGQNNKNNKTSKSTEEESPIWWCQNVSPLSTYLQKRSVGQRTEFAVEWTFLLIFHNRDDHNFGCVARISKNVNSTLLESEDEILICLSF